MADILRTPTMREILYCEFMEPYGLSTYGLAKRINVPVSRIQEILAGTRKVTVDTSLRLSFLFGVSEDYFLKIQNDIDIRNAKMDKRLEYSVIAPINTAEKSVLQEQI